MGLYGLCEKARASRIVPPVAPCGCETNGARRVCLTVLLTSKPLSRKQKSAFPAYNSCSRFR